jgi:hypothetical protein
VASLIVNTGLQAIGELASLTTPTFGQIRSMAVDNATASTSAFAATMSKLNDAAAATTFAATSFSPTPSRASQTISHVAVFATSQANFTIGRLSLHNVANGSVSISSTTLVSGVDQQSITKTTDFTLTPTLRITYTSV